jgi:hypothetical protein
MKAFKTLLVFLLVLGLASADLVNNTGLPGSHPNPKSSQTEINSVDVDENNKTNGADTSNSNNGSNGKPVPSNTNGSNSDPEVQSFLDRTVEDPCPGQNAVQNSVPKSSNGCGSNFWQRVVGTLLYRYSNHFSSCCNDHDICYDTCGGPDFRAHKEQCDDSLESCGKRLCKEAAQQ